MGNKKKDILSTAWNQNYVKRRSVIYLWRFLIPLLLNIQIFFSKNIYIETVIYNRKGKEEEEDLVITKHHSTPF